MKILVLTTIYKDKDDPIDAATTPVVQNFAKEWVLSGHEVVLIHNFNVFPKALYNIPQFVWDKLSAKKGFRTILNKKQTKDAVYNRDGVDVYRLTLKKPLPLFPYSQKTLDKSIKKIDKVLLKRGFVPDVIIAHMENPQIYQLVQLKKIYPNAITSLVFHKIDYLHKKQYKKWREEYLSQIDRIGFRSKEVYRDACSMIGFDRSDYFFCPSGIAKEFVLNSPDFSKKFSDETMRILYVGQFIPRKHVETIISAVGNLIKKGVKVELDLIGGGVDENKLKNQVHELNIDDKIHFLGRKTHGEVLENMKDSDIFVMVSDKEVFGLVYTEAMSQGCIVVASTEGGMEGIIESGLNGYLSAAGDSEMLTNTLVTIKDLKLDQKNAMAKESYKTALKYTEGAVAEAYLNNVLAVDE